MVGSYLSKNQTNKQSTAHPQHHPIPKLLHAHSYFTHHVQGKIKTIAGVRKKQIDRCGH